MIFSANFTATATSIYIGITIITNKWKTGVRNTKGICEVVTIKFLKNYYFLEIVEKMRWKWPHPISWKILDLFLFIT